MGSDKSHPRQPDMFSHPTVWPIGGKYVSRAGETLVLGDLVVADENGALVRCGADSVPVAVVLEIYDDGSNVLVGTIGMFPMKP